MKFTIRQRLTIAFICLAVVPLCLVGGILGRQSYKTLETMTLKLQDEMGQEVLNKVEGFFDKTENEMWLAGSLRSLERDSQDVQERILKLLMSPQSNVFDKLLLFDQKGELLSFLSRFNLNTADTVNDPEHAEFLIAKSRGETSYSPVLFDDRTGEPYIIIAMPLHDFHSGIVQNVLVADVRIKKIWNIISDIKTTPGQSIYVVDMMGNVVAHRDPSVVLRGTHFKVPDHDGFQYGLSGERALLTLKKASFGKQEFNIIIEQRSKDAFALAIYLWNVTAAVILLAVLAVFLLRFLIVKQIIQPIHNMAMTAMAVSTGDLTQHVDVKSDDELGILGSAFNSMTAQLKNLIEGLELKIAERTSQLKDAQSELLRQERLATLGKVTATIAHEIRNPLATVNTSVFSIGAAIEKNDTERIKRALGLAERNIKRCDNIITELLDFTRKLEIRPIKVHIDEWIEGILDEQIWPEGIVCRRNLSSGIEVRIDSEHMRRVMINVITNAVQAMSEENAPGKELTVETARSGENLEIRVTDSGIGIPEEMRHRIFEPLFSTKGFGVGLGLSITKDIMEKHNGGIELKSRVGNGTTVILWMPIEE